MLLEKGIDMTLGTADIRRCHWIIDVIDELRLRGLNYEILKEDFSKEDVREKVLYRLQ